MTRNGHGLSLRTSEVPLTVDQFDLLLLCCLL
jgi:hypothetical protein